MAFFFILLLQLHCLANSFHFLVAWDKDLRDSFSFTRSVPLNDHVCLKCFTVMTFYHIKAKTFLVDFGQLPLSM